MIVNELAVVPDADTLAYLSTLMTGAPLDIGLSEMYVVLAQSQDTIVPDPNTVFLARAGSLGVWFDGATHESSLILPLESPALEARAAEVRAYHKPAFYADAYIPFMVVVPGLPPLSRHYRRFRNSLSDALWANRQELVFEREFVTIKEYRSVPYGDFYASYEASARALTRS